MNKAKRILAILLVLVMAVSLFACGGNNNSGNAGNNNASNNNNNTTNNNDGDGDGDVQPVAGGPAELGFYDRDYDYTQHKKFKVAYLCSGTGVMFDSFDTSFTTWAEQLNCQYTGMWAPAENTTEAFISGVETYSDMGYDGLILDADPNLGGAIANILDPMGIVWMMGMAQARDYSAPYSFEGEAIIGPLHAPNVGFNNVAVGTTTAEGLMDWKEEAFPDVAWENVGFISIDYSASPQIHERSLGNKMAWANRTGLGTYDPSPTSELKNFIVADTVSGGFDQATATNLVTQILANPPAGIEVWLVFGAFWDFASGAAVAIDNMNLTSVSCVTTFGAGANATALWDAGEETCIRISLETASSVFAEAIFNGLWAMMAGFATADTLWPEWALVYDKGDIFETTDELDPLSQYPYVKMEDGKPVILEERNLASMILPMLWVTPENYVEFYGWVDLYQYGPDATDDERGYPEYPLATDINLYVARGEVPAYFSQYPTR